MVKVNLSKICSTGIALGGFTAFGGSIAGALLSHQILYIALSSISSCAVVGGGLTFALFPPFKAKAVPPKSLKSRIEKGCTEAEYKKQNETAQKEISRGYLEKAIYDILYNIITLDEKSAPFALRELSSSLRNDKKLLKEISAPIAELLNFDKEEFSNFLEQLIDLREAEEAKLNELSKDLVKPLCLSVEKSENIYYRLECYFMDNIHGEAESIKKILNTEFEVFCPSEQKASFGIKENSRIEAFLKLRELNEEKYGKIYKAIKNLGGIHSKRKIIEANRIKVEEMIAELAQKIAQLLEKLGTI